MQPHLRARFQTPESHLFPALFGTLLLYHQFLNCISHTDCLSWVSKPPFVFTDLCHNSLKSLFHLKLLISNQLIRMGKAIPGEQAPQRHTALQPFSSTRYSWKRFQIRLISCAWHSKDPGAGAARVWITGLATWELVMGGNCKSPTPNTTRRDGPVRDWRLLQTVVTYVNIENVQIAPIHYSGSFRPLAED